MTLNKRFYNGCDSTLMENNGTKKHHNLTNASSSTERDLEKLHLGAPPRFHTRINIHPAAISSLQATRRVKTLRSAGSTKEAADRGSATTILILLFIILFIATLSIMHYEITQFEQETKEQTHFLRRTLNNTLFDPLSLPQCSTLKGRFDGYLMIDGQIAPHSFQDAVFVNKDIAVVNGTGTHLVNRHRLRAYDYDEVKGLVAAFNNAIVYGAEPLVYDCRVKYRPGGAANLNLDNVQSALNTITIGNPQPQGHRPTINKINGTLVLIAQFWGSRYYHWMAESFPRIALVKDYLDAHSDARLLFHRPTEKQDEIYKLIGIDPGRVIEYQGHNVYHAEHLLVPTATAEGRTIQRAGHVLNKHFRSGIERHFYIPKSDPVSSSLIQIGDAPSIIVQQRLRGSSRYMKNGDDLIQAIKDAYPNAVVEVFYPSATIWDTFRMHYWADLVIGPHGAGESNALFMRPGAIILEIHPKVFSDNNDWLNPCHNHTSKSVGVKHYYVRSKTGSISTPMDVDVDVVLRKLLEVFPYNSTYNGLRDLDKTGDISSDLSPDEMALGSIKVSSGLILEAHLDVVG